MLPGGLTAPGLERMDLASDDEWLRKRTNRVLDLVDDQQVESTLMAGNCHPNIERVPYLQERPSEMPTHLASEGEDNVEQEHYQSNPSQLSEGDQSLVSKMQSHHAAANPHTGNDYAASTRLFVRNLYYEVTEADLDGLFSQFGNVEEVSCFPLLPKSNIMM